MKIISIANHKGGVGKTTSVASIGLGLSLRGFKVLLVDLDAQANLTAFFLPEADGEERKSIYDSLVSAEPLPIYQIRENLALIPSGLEMARVEGDLSARIARERVLLTLLEPVKDAYDYVLIDCPPSLGVVTTNAFVASTDVYVPLTAEALPLKGMRMLEDYVNAIRVVKPDLCISGIFLTRYNNRNLNQIVEKQIRANYPGIVFNTRISENITLAEIPLLGGNIYEHAPKSRGANDYSDLTDEIVERTKNG